MITGDSCEATFLTGATVRAWAKATQRATFSENPAGKSAVANRRRANRRALSHHLGAPTEAPTDAGEGE